MCNTEPVHVEVSTPTSESLPHLDLVTANQYVGTAHISLDGPFPYPSFRSFLFFSVQCLIFQLLKELLWMCPFTSCGTKFTTPSPMSQLLRAKVIVYKVIVYKVIVMVVGKFRT